VNVTLNFGGANDGEAGERDEIIGSNEQVVGGRAGDTLRAPASSTASHNILGLGGGDNIEGSEGADTLSGDAGGDTINSFVGDDRVFARDGELESVDCGLQTDTADVDSFDNFGRSCENGTIGVLRLAPRALRVRAGETAELRPSWRHPRAWRRLRRIELRLDRDGAPVGEVTIRPRGGRIGADGAVKLLRKRSRLSREGKTVIARLAVRLDERLAGQTLQVDVEATDARGARQLEPDAGTVRIAR
jgi:hypothetical protein